MNLAIVVLFNLLLLNVCQTANVNRESTLSNTQQQNSSENSAKTIASNEDFEYALFDTCDLADLVHYAKQPRCSDFVRKHIFPVKYQNYLFGIHFTGRNNAQDKVQHYSKAVYIPGYNLPMDIIEYFGESIHKLVVDTEQINDDRSAAIYKQINEYCSESMIHLDLQSVNGLMLKQFQKPFSNVIDLMLRLETNQIGSIASLNETFPKLQLLHIMYLNPRREDQFNGTRLIESDVPHMKHVIKLSVNHNLNNQTAIIQKQIQRIFEKNPQIQIFIYSVELLGGFIHEISKNLPNLEELTIRDIKFDIEPVQFGRVKHFALRSGARNPVDKLSFPLLETLKMSYSINCVGASARSGNSRELWLTFFKNHQNIKQLNVSIQNHTGFVEFVSELSKLEEIYIESEEIVQIEHFTGLIGGHKNLMKLQYSFTGHQPSLDHAELDVYNEKFGNQWKITYLRQQWSILKFERKI